MTALSSDNNDQVGPIVKFRFLHFKRILGLIYP
jgi:hypothetical protein